MKNLSTFVHRYVRLEIQLKGELVLCSCVVRPQKRKLTPLQRATYPLICPALTTETQRIEGRKKTSLYNHLKANNQNIMIPLNVSLLLGVLL